MLLVGCVVAWGGYFGYRHYQRGAQPDPASSPITSESESEDERAQGIAQAFGSPSAVDDAQVEAFVETLGKAIADREKDAVIAMVSSARMLDAVETETGKKLPPSARSAVEEQLDAQIYEFFDPRVVKTEVRHIDRDSKGNIVVYVRLLDRDQAIVKARWWLFHDGEGLRWWDGEDLQVSLRLSALITAGILAADAGHEAQVGRFIEVLSQLAELSFDDLEAVRRLAAQIDGLDTEGLPHELRSYAAVARATMASALGEDEDCLRRLNALEEQPLGRLELPLRHFQRGVASLGTERWEDAATAAQHYLDLLGPDADAYHLLGLAQFHRGRRVDALAAFDAGIDDNPGLADNYAGVALVAEDTEAVAERLATIPNTAVIDAAATELLGYDSPEAMARLLDAAASAKPEWDIAAWRAQALSP